MVDLGVSDDQPIARLHDAYTRLLKRRGLDIAFEDIPPPLSRDWDPSPTHIAGETRGLESTRRYCQFADVGTEPKAVFLHRLGTVTQRRGPYLSYHLSDLQLVLNDLFFEVRGWLNARMIDVPCLVMPAVFPSADMNARCRPARDAGVLILVNSGLMDMLHSVLKVNIANSLFGSSPPLLDEEQASIALAEIFNAFIYGKGAALAQPLPHISTGRVQTMAFLLRRVEQFVVAHELGHLINGDVNLPGSGDDPDRELRADSFAIELLSSSLPRSKDERAKVAKYLAGAINIFFKTAYAVEKLRSNLNLAVNAGASHPVIRERIVHAFTEIERLFPGDRPMEMIEGWAMWLDARMPRAEELIREVNSFIVRPSEDATFSWHGL